MKFEFSFYLKFKNSLKSSNVVVEISLYFKTLVQLLVIVVVISIKVNIYKLIRRVK